MSNKSLTVCGTGDSLFLQEFPEEYHSGISPVADFINSCGLKITNLETNFSDFEYFAGAYSGGTWLNTRRECLPELLRYGFNCFGTANNHCMDYAFNGLISTLETLDQAKLAHCGTGRGFEEAAAPAILEIDGVKCAVFAVDSSFVDASRAGKGTGKLAPRPGVNYLRFNTTFHVSDEDMAHLRRIAGETHMNYYRQLLIDTGFLTPDPPGVLVMGNQSFTTDPDTPQTTCHAGDKKRILDAVKAAKREYDYIFMLIHCHETDLVREENPPAFLEEFCRGCIDAGVSAVFGGGCHRLRPIEIYKNAPIFYSLGDFIYQGLQIEYLPADFMEKYGIDINSSAQEALFIRSRGNQVGLHCNKLNYQSLLPKLEFENGNLTGFSLMPLQLNFNRRDRMNGLPEAADGKEAEEILDLINDLSSRYAVKFRNDGGLFKLA